MHLEGCTAYLAILCDLLGGAVQGVVPIGQLVWVGGWGLTLRVFGVTRVAVLASRCCFGGAAPHVVVSTVPSEVFLGRHTVPQAGVQVHLVAPGKFSAAVLGLQLE